MQRRVLDSRRRKLPQSIQVSSQDRAISGGDVASVEVEAACEHDA